MFNSVPIDPTSDLIINNVENKASTSMVKKKMTDKELAKSSNIINSMSESENSSSVQKIQKKYSLSSEVLEQMERKATEERVKALLYHLGRFGIPQQFLFELPDLIDCKNVPKVTRCVATLAKMVRKNYCVVVLTQKSQTLDI